jgi:hypothetical protein
VSRKYRVSRRCLTLYIFVVKGFHCLFSLFNMNFSYEILRQFVNVRNTVPFHSIWQSCVTGPPKMLKCHGCHSDFYGVLDSF